MATPRTPITERALAPFAWLALAFMVLVILWGAIVRTTGSGAGCGNHWPLCNGDFVPHHPRLATLIEFTHRSMTGILTTLIAALTAWVFWKRPNGHPARRASLWVCLFLITEALLGALLVKGGYVEANASNTRVAMQCIHFTNTMLLLAALTLTAWWITHAVSNTKTVTEPNPGVESSRTEGGAPCPDSRTWVPTNLNPRSSHTRDLALASILLTLIVGATGAVAALADTLFPSSSLAAGLAEDFAANAPLIIRTRWIHPAVSVLVLVCVVLLCLRVRTRTALVVASLLGLQFILGAADVLLLAPQWMQVLHLLGADLFWIALVILASEALPSKHLT